MRATASVFSSFPLLPPISEGMEPTLDSCLPELLAGDLHISNGVFAGKNLTAGKPVPGMSIEEKMGKMDLPPFGPGPTSISSLPPLVIPPRVHSLRTIQERCSMVSFLDQRGSANYDNDARSYSDSTSDSELSGDMEAPSITFRHQSAVTTAPTSVASTQQRLSPIPASPHFTTSRGCSWIDGDSDYEAQLDSTIDRLACLSPRPPTPPRSSNRPVRGHAIHENRRRSDTMPESRLPSANLSRARSPERRPSIKAEESALRRAYSQREGSHGSASPTGFNLAPFASSKSRKLKHLELQEPPSPLTSVPPLPPLPPVPPLPHLPKIEHPDLASMYPSTVIDDSFQDESTILPSHGRHYTRPQTAYIQGSPPPSPLPSVQAWLFNGSQPHAAQFANDELAKAVPLPPDVIETLRVSIACFPETMLLTHSLTIETIRSYAKKVRQPSAMADALRSPLIEPPRPMTPRKSIWKKVVSYRRGGGGIDGAGVSIGLGVGVGLGAAMPGNGRRDSSSTIDRACLQSASSSSLEAIKPWAPLQNIFGSTSDYICDALYAHILAYNYISALVPRHAPGQPRKGSHAAGGGGSEKQHDDIPKKAASLLGLTPSASAAVLPHSVSSMGGVGGGGGLMKSISSSFLKEAPSSPSTLPATYESAVRDIQAGLLKCITGLVATARLVGEGGAGVGGEEQRLVEMGPGELDVVLTRSLCEVVRLAEDGVSGL